MLFLFYAMAPVSHDCVTESQHEQYQDPETKKAKLNSAKTHFISYICAFFTASR